MPHSGRPPGTGEVEGLFLFEHVLLQLLPVVVAAGEDLLHERVEVRLGAEPGRAGREHSDAKAGQQGSVRMADLVSHDERWQVGRAQARRSQFAKAYGAAAKTG